MRRRGKIEPLTSSSSAKRLCGAGRPRKQQSRAIGPEPKIPSNACTLARAAVEPPPCPVRSAVTHLRYSDKPRIPCRDHSVQAHI